LDNRPNVPAGLKGRVLTPTFLRQSVSLGRPAEGGDMKLVVITHIAEQADNLPPLGKPVRTLLNMRADEAHRYVCNSSRLSKFEPVEMAEVPSPLTEEGVCDLLLQAPDEFKSTLADLTSWHIAHEGDNRRIVIVEANALFLRDTPLSSGNFLLVIEDESAEDIMSDGTTVFIPDVLEQQLNFAPGSRLIILGRTATGPAYDRETRSTIEGERRTMLNAVGVWSIPQFRIPREETNVLSATST